MAVALAALAFAFPAALFVLWPLFTRRSAAPEAAAEDARMALEAEKVMALRVLRELEGECQAGLLAEDDYAGLRARYEARAGAILRRLDALGPIRPARAPVAPAARSARVTVPWTDRSLLLAGGGAGILVVGVALGVLVMRHSGPARLEPLAVNPAPVPLLAPDAEPPGEAPSAAAGDSPRPLPQPVLEGMLRAAHQSLDAGRYPEAIAAYKAVLKRDPRNTDAITHLGVILALAGHTDGALDAFERALAVDPDYAHALWDKARVLYEQRQDYAGAIAAWERFVAVSAPGADREQALARIREAKARLTEAPAPSPLNAGPGPKRQ